MRNSKWPPLCFIKFYCHSHPDFIIDTGSPWARIGPRAPPTTLQEWYHFDQGTLVNGINDVTRKKLGRDMGYGHFSKLSLRKCNLYNISSSKSHRIIIFVSTPMLSWSKYRMKSLIKRICHSYIANSKKIQDGCQQK